jgi:hypothetical protein
LAAFGKHHFFVEARTRSLAPLPQLVGHERHEDHKPLYSLQPIEFQVIYGLAA